MNKSSFDNDYCAIYDGLFYPGIPVKYQFLLFHQVLDAWRNRSLLGEHYNENDLKFYDGVLGFVIRQGNQYHRNSEAGDWAPAPILELMKTWQYQGLIYRVVNSPRSRIKYHKKIASWTKDANSFDHFNKLCPDEKYTFIVADTGSSFGFDVNKYDSNAGRSNPYLCHEDEIIFPMDKKYVKAVFWGTLKDFKDFLNKFNT